jgi:hypothetical protein
MSKLLNLQPCLTCTQRSTVIRTTFLTVNKTEGPIQGAPLSYLSVDKRYLSISARHREVPGLLPIVLIIPLIAFYGLESFDLLRRYDKSQFRLEIVEPSFLCPVLGF